MHIYDAGKMDTKFSKYDNEYVSNFSRYCMWDNT